MASRKITQGVEYIQTFSGPIRISSKLKTLAQVKEFLRCARLKIPYSKKARALHSANVGTIQT